MKREGQRAGVWDLFLPVPVGHKSGLWIEMKRPGGKLSKEQKWWGEQMRGLGYRTEVCYSSRDAAQAICDYLGIEFDDWWRE